MPSKNKMNKEFTVWVGYPPIVTSKGTALLSQNRQFQFFHTPTYIYPMIPAQGATMLHKAGYHVKWVDGIAEQIPYKTYLETIKKEKPDLVIIEAKTPVIAKFWKIVSDIKKANPTTITCIIGDHVTAMPMETMENSNVDWVITGGDYDFLMVNLCEHLTKGILLEPGFYYRENGKIVNNGMFIQNHDWVNAPMIDRELTKWQLYAYHNGNYKYTPGTYTMVGRDCWWRKDGGCTFCSWTTTYKRYQQKKPEQLLDEIEMLIDTYGIKEIFDDTGTFPVGPWLRKFCNGMIERGLNKKVIMGCNMRAGALTKEEYALMGKANFRFILYGIESANQKTLDKLNKGTTNKQIYESCRWAKEGGLDPHLTIMMGYPWETIQDAKNTVELAKTIFKNGWADTLQATIVIPYPGTPLYKECDEKGWLMTKDWEKYDMRQQVMKGEVGPDEVKQLTQELYRVFFSPRFVLRKLTQIRRPADLKFVYRGVKSVFGHLLDFSKGSEVEKANV